ncbi:AraC family transcriptional regulator [Flavobacterium sp. LHD-80]|uniref:AraC family transcriptional regulator n=1 Tax=Flavobacterium sp. LHD-80 TaxID=3071411 RepID=UPI0027DEC939|nr:AraC family transcriptional regulator [Flavobacterium sp. LHD-80]MDQ6473030.1 AraC family transcriptional regulator [Flavobacterium sp. LHD-80]
MESSKQHDEFRKEKLISLPNNVWQKAIKENPVLSHLYITHIGYFPKATYYYREQKKGCTDNILIYCVRGKGWHSVNNKRFEISPNQFFIIPATNEHIIYGADEHDPWTIYWVHFSSREIDVFNKSFNIGLFDGPRQIACNEKGIELWHTMYQSLEMGYGKENITKANLCLYHFISSFLYPDVNVNEKKQDEKDFISNTITYMRNNFAGKLTLEDLALINNLSPSHFSLLFKKSTGMAPLDYFIHLKLQHACLLLITSEVKVKIIAADLGYDDPYYFSRLFKKHMKVSPLQYRFSPQSKSL